MTCEGTGTKTEEYELVKRMIEFLGGRPHFWSNAKALQTLFDCWAVNVGGVIDG